MSKDLFIRRVKDQLRRVDVRMADLDGAIAKTEDDRRRVELRAEQCVLADIRRQLGERLEELERQPEEGFKERRAEWQDDWFALVRDLEERISRLT